MTLVILLLLDFGAVLIMSSIEDVPVLQTIGDIWNGTATVSHPAFTTGGSQMTFKGTGIPATTPSGATPGIPAQQLGRAAGPAQQADAYHMAVVRAYLQSQR